MLFTFRSETVRYEFYRRYFHSKEIILENFEAPIDILEAFLPVFKNLDFEFSQNIELLQELGAIKSRPRSFYNYIMCSKSILGNMLKIGNKTLDGNLITAVNFRKFNGSVYYGGKARGRRDLDHMKEAFKGSIFWDFPVGSKLYTCLHELQDKGIVLVNGFNESNHYMAHNREQAIFSFLGLKNLTNKYNGTTYGNFTQLNKIGLKNYGLLVMYAIFKNYCNDGPLPFMMDDLRIALDMRDQGNWKDDDDDEDLCQHNNVCCADCNIYL